MSFPDAWNAVTFVLPEKANQRLSTTQAQQKSVRRKIVIILSCIDTDLRRVCGLNAGARHYSIESKIFFQRSRDGGGALRALIYTLHALFALSPPICAVAMVRRDNLWQGVVTARGAGRRLSLRLG